MDRNELYHHGIKGMKWGVRRTPAQLGRKPTSKRKSSSSFDKLKAKHKAKKVAKAKAEAEAKKRADAEREAREAARKPVKKMSDAELKDRINRLEMEKRYKQLMNETDSVARGKNFALRVLEKSGENIATQTTTYIMGQSVNKIAEAIGTTTDDEGQKVVKEAFKAIINPKKGQKEK